MAESKHDKFVRLAEVRTNNELKQIELIGNLSNTSVYEYSYEDVEKIIKTLKKSINDLEETYRMDKKNKKFTLK